MGFLASVCDNEHPIHSGRGYLFQHRNIANKKFFRGTTMFSHSFTSLNDAIDRKTSERKKENSKSNRRIEERPFNRKTVDSFGSDRDATTLMCCNFMFHTVDQSSIVGLANIQLWENDSSACS